MSWLRLWIWKLLYGRFTDPAELDRELQIHLELEAQERLERGMSASEARYAAKRDLGNETGIRETVHEMRPISQLESWGKDAKSGIRTLWRNPGFTVVAVLSLAIGIGSNAAIFTIADQMLFRLLPVRDPGRLVLLQWDGRFIGGSTRGWKDAFSLSMYNDLRDSKPSEIDGITARWQEPVVVGIDKRIERGIAEMVSGNYFDLLGVRAVLGRTLSAGDETGAEAAPLVVLSYDYWKNRFGSDPTVLNRKVYLKGYPATVIGVAEPGFAGIEALAPSDLFISFKSPVNSIWGDRDRRNSIWLKLVARLHPGVEQLAAQTAISVAYVHALQKDLDANPRDADTATQYLKNKLLLMNAEQGLTSRRDVLTRPLYILLAMVGVLLLIACVNVANLAIARTARRQREIAIRASLGASRLALIRLVLTETLLLAIAGGAGGLMLAQWTAALLIRMLPLERIGIAIHSTADWRILAFTAAVSLLAVLISGLTPAFKAARSDAAPILRNEGTSLLGSIGQARTRRVLVIAQVALSLVLLVGAGLFLRSLHRLFSVDTGIQTNRLLAFSIDASQTRYSPQRNHSLSVELQTRLANIPGVVSVSAAAAPVLAGSYNQNTIVVPRYTPKPGESTQAGYNGVLPAFLSTLRIPLIAGREFSEHDNEAGPPVAIVNETFAKQFFGSAQAAIGGQLGPPRRLLPPGQPYYLYEIVGVVKDSRSVNLRTEPMPWTYMSALQQSSLPTAFYVAVRSEQQGVADAIRNVVREIDTSMVVYDVKTVETQVAETHYKEVMLARLSTAFAILATTLAMVGLYGVTAFVVARRTQEIGIRIAFGAPRARILFGVLNDVLLMTMIGIGIGAGASFAIAKPLESQLYQIQRIEPGILAGGIAVILTVSIAAGILPALRAMRVDPILALRHE
jgi:putative ABC transport system permease protein